MKEAISEGDFSDEEKPEEKKPAKESVSEGETEEEKTKVRTPIPDKESAEDSDQEALPVARERSQKATESEKPARSHRKKGEHRHHHHHHRKSTQPAPEREENVLGDFVKEEKEAISSGSDSEDTAQPTYTFASPITRLSRSPTPMVHRSLVIAPGRRFVPQKAVEAISSSSDDEDPTFLGRTSIIPSRSFASSIPTAGSRASMVPGSTVGRQNKAFGSSFGANRSSVFSRNSTVPRSRNSTLIDSDSDDNSMMRRTSFAARPSMAQRASTMGRPSFGRSVRDDDNAKTMSKLDRYRSM